MLARPLGSRFLIGQPRGDLLPLGDRLAQWCAKIGTRKPLLLAGIDGRKRFAVSIATDHAQGVLADFRAAGLSLAVPFGQLVLGKRARCRITADRSRRCRLGHLSPQRPAAWAAWCTSRLLVDKSPGCSTRGLAGLGGDPGERKRIERSIMSGPGRRPGAGLFAGIVAIEQPLPGAQPAAFGVWVAFYKVAQRGVADFAIA